MLNLKYRSHTGRAQSRFLLSTAVVLPYAPGHGLLYVAVASESSDLNANMHFHSYKLILYPIFGQIIISISVNYKTSTLQAMCFN
jgi:hypothetical protein